MATEATEAPSKPMSVAELAEIANKLKQCRDQLAKEYEREPSNEELAEEMNLPLSTIEGVLRSTAKAVAEDEAPEDEAPEEEAADPYENMIQKRLAVLEEQYEAFEKPDYLKEDESKIVPFIMVSIAELYTRQDIIMDKLYYKDLNIDEDLNIKPDDGGE